MKMVEMIKERDIICEMLEESYTDGCFEFYCIDGEEREKLIERMYELDSMIYN